VNEPVLITILCQRECFTEEFVPAAENDITKKQEDLGRSSKTLWSSPSIGIQWSSAACRLGLARG
jgi:hypothetical protein